MQSKMIEMNPGGMTQIHGGAGGPGWWDKLCEEVDQFFEGAAVGAVGGAAVGAGAGLCGGPLAPVTSSAGGVFGGAVGGILGGFANACSN